MGPKRLLIADADARMRDEFLRVLGESWIVVATTTCAAAMEEAAKQAFDVVVANYNLADLGGAELLNRLRAINAKTRRFIAADPALKAKVMGQVLGGDQFLSLPFDWDNLKAAINHSQVDDYGMNQGVRELVGRIRTFPTIPSLYLEVNNALKDANATTTDIGAIIAKDMSMTTKILQVINSAYFGLPRNVTDPTEAVGILGFETVKSLIVAVKLLGQYDKLKPVYFSIDNIWRHSTSVARTARVMALLETNNPGIAGTAYTAGLMHDMGKVILAANFDDQYHGAHNLARKNQMPLWEVEREIFGATHGEIGAYLLSLWNMPPEVVRVAALHHNPTRSDDQGFTALTAVHVANALEHEAAPEQDGLVPATVDCGYLQQITMEDRMDMWRFARREPDATKYETKFRKKNEKPAAAPAAAAPAVSAAPAPALARKSVPTSSSMPTWLPWAGVGFAILAGVICLTVAMTRPHATAVAETAAPAKTASVPVAAAETSKPAIAPSAAAIPTPSPVAVAAAPAPAPAPPPVVAKSPLDSAKLDAIFYSSKNPTAMVNGVVATVNDEVAGCRVLAINRSSVILAFGSRQRTLMVH